MVRSLIFALLLLAPALAHGQSARVAEPEENLRGAPDGPVLAIVLRGTQLGLGSSDGQWRQATLEGWIWAQSVAPRDQDGHDLVVLAEGGENLRAEPNGALIARLREGMLLDEIERRGAWIRVRRTAWIWGPSLSVRNTAGAAGAPSGNAVAASSRRGAAAGAWSRIGTAGGALLAAPDRDTLAAVRPETPVEVLARQGNWARVRVEGWVWVPSLAAAADTGSVLRNVSPDLLAANPQGFQGRILEWSVQFIALQHAETIRTDFYEGEPFILARGPADYPGFVYIAVPPDRVAQVERLAPLQRITVLARVRTARSPLMEAPVLDLITIR